MQLPTTVLITGPESTGKSHLTEQLAQHFGGTPVPEYARTYLEQLERPYLLADLSHILRGQLAQETAARTTATPFVFCDTGPEVIYVWSKVKYGAVSADIAEALHLQTYHIRLLCYPDLAWTPDPLREAPDAAVRLALFDVYCQLHEQLGAPYTVIRGQGATRLQQAITAVEAFAEK